MKNKDLWQRLLTEIGAKDVHFFPKQVLGQFGEHIYSIEIINNSMHIVQCDNSGYELCKREIVCDGKLIKELNEHRYNEVKHQINKFIHVNA